MSDKISDILQEQIAYYQARATEYDEWFMRQGRYDHGPEQNQQWFEEIQSLVEALDMFLPGGRILELACGTGWWTEQLAQYADTMTASLCTGRLARSSSC